MIDHYPHTQARYVKAPPMSDEAYEAHFEKARREMGVEAAAAAHEDVTLMVKSNYAPFYAVPYPLFVEEQREGRHIDSPLTPAEQYAAAALIYHEA